MITLLVWALLVDPCTGEMRPPPGTAADAAGYLEVAEAERAAGEWRTAALAYRRALALDPANAAARTALAELCRDARAGADPLQAALERERAGDPEGARAAFATIAAGGGADAAAAAFFLGLYAYRDGALVEAVRQLDRAAGDPRYAEPALELRRLARRAAPFSLFLLAQPEIDTNVELLPGQPPVGSRLGSPRSDGDLLLAAAFSARRRALSGQLGVSYRKQLRLTDFDFLQGRAEAGAAGRVVGARARAGYAFVLELLGGDLSALAHEGRLEWGPVHYAVRRRDYQTDDLHPFSGWAHALALGVTTLIGSGAAVDLAVAGAREGALSPLLAHVTASVEASGRLRVSARVRALAAAEALWARYDEDARVDWRGALRVGGEIDLGDRWLLLGGVDLSASLSDVDDFDYRQLVARAGVASYWGGP